MDKTSLKTIGHMTYGIYVLTTAYEGRPNGMIASWATQVSYDPFLVMVAVHPNRYSHKLIEKSGHFALHILSKDQSRLLKRFKGPDPVKKFKSIEWETGETGSPVLKDCIAHMECKVIQSLSPGNHTLFIGQVLGTRFNRSDTPLSTLDYDGVYTGKR